LTEQHWSEARGPFAALLSPPLLWLAAFFLAPMAAVWLYSFGENRGLADIELTWTLANYARALDPLYLGILLKSALYAAASTILCLGLGFPVALAIAFASPRAKTWLLLAIMLPFWTNMLVRTYALMAVLRTEGLVNQILGAIWEGVGLGPFQPLPLLNNDGAVVLGLVYTNLPLMVLPLFAALDRLDRSLVEAGVLLTFIAALGAYLIPDLLGGPSSQMAANLIERQFKRANDWPLGAALSFLLMYVTFAAVALEVLFRRRRA
jgi:spermidine/putrescine transport system permease protein